MLRFLFACLVLAGAAVPAVAQTGTTATGTSNALNPAISLNGLFLGQITDPASDDDGFKVQEMELSLSSVVDPYFKAWASLVFEPASGDAEAELAIEEAWADILGLPAGLGARVGRFKVPLGWMSRLHPHQYPMILPPRAFVATIGEEGPSDVGIMPSYSPVLPWYMNVIAYVTDGATELFAGDSRALAYGGRLENLWDLGEATTFEVNGSVMNGPLDAATDERRTLYGADARLQWTDPRKTHGHALRWVAEFLVDHQPGTEDVRGAYTVLEYRVARQWWLGAQYSWNSLVPEDTGERGNENEITGQIAWVPSEFSELRTNVAWTDPIDGDSEFAVRLQLNLTIGAHPAHSY